MRLCFIGTGNMASAMIRGILKKGLVPAKEIIGTAKSKEGRRRAKEELGILVAADNKEAAGQAELIVLSVKPALYGEVIQEIKDVVKKEQLILTIAPGKTLAWLEEQFEKPVKIIRAMPNTPAMVGEGMTAVCRNAHVDDEAFLSAVGLLESFGQVEAVPERLMDAVVAASGSAPAYIFILLEAMADAAVSAGMTRAQAYRFAAQATLGSAKMALETGRTPSELKDMVCSPAGTTIEAVRTLERLGFRSAVFEAMKACEEASKAMQPLRIGETTNG